MMSAGAPDTIEAFYLPGTAGRLFTIFRGPATGTAPQVGVLHVPPFADEMNKSRRQMTLQSRRLAARGFGTLCIDLYGTGDSEGEFLDARWEIWVEDLLTAVRWLEKRGMRKIVLWGVRLGALLSVDIAGRLGDRVSRIILWQPVVSGKLHIGQFLRLRAAAEMMAGDGGLNTRALREQLQRGEPVEIAGYDLHPQLAGQIESRDLRRMSVPGSARVDWLEILTDTEQAIPPVSHQAVTAWAADGVEVLAGSVVGEQFWATPEITVVDDLLDRTDRILAADHS